MVTPSSIAGALLWTTAMHLFGFAGVFPGTPPDTLANTALFASLCIIGGTLFGLSWHRLYGAWFREYFGLDPEYRRIENNGEIDHDRTGRQPWLHYIFGALFGLTATAYFGLACVHYLEGSCRHVQQCFQPVSSFGDWLIILIVLAVIVEWIEKRYCHRLGARSLPQRRAG
jgi:hypothetical protein